MNHRQFFTQLGFVSLGIIVVIFLFNLIPAFQAFQSLSWISFGFFLVLSVLMYFVGHYAANSSDKNSFLQIVMATTFFKMVLCLAIIIVYAKFAQPESKLFILPFLAIYIIFTIFETYFMMKLSYLNPTKKSKE